MRGMYVTKKPPLWILPEWDCWIVNISSSYLNSEEENAPAGRGFLRDRDPAETRLVAFEATPRIKPGR